MADAMIAALGWTLLDFLWQGMVIAGACLLLRALCNTARQRLWCGQLALLAMAVAPLYTLWQRWPASGGGAAAGAPVEELQVFAVVASAPSLDAVHEWMPAVVAAWGVGVLLLGLRAWWRWTALRRLIRTAVPLPAHWQQRVAELRQRIGIARPVALLESVRVMAPMLVGWLKPVILMPAGMCLRLPSEQVELLLAHELAHVRRADVLVNVLQVVLETVLFYHPAVHLISRRVREDREVCCDDLVAACGGDRLDYARALLALAEDRARVPQSRLVLAATGGALLSRIERIVGVQGDSERSRGGRLPLMLLVVGVFVLGMAQQAAFAPLYGSALPLPAFARGTGLAGLPDLAIGDAFVALETAVAPPPAAESALPALEGPAIAMAAPAATLEAIPDAWSGFEPAALPPPVAETAAAQPPQPLRIEPPQYPRAARLQGIEGYVELSYRISAGGRVEAVRVDGEGVSDRVFERAARDALDKWRFPVGDYGSRRWLQRFDFTLGRAEAEADAESKFVTCEMPTGTRVCRKEL